MVPFDSTSWSGRFAGKTLACVIRLGKKHITVTASSWYVYWAFSVWLKVMLNLKVTKWDLRLPSGEKNQAIAQQMRCVLSKILSLPATEQLEIVPQATKQLSGRLLCTIHRMRQESSNRRLIGRKMCSLWWRRWGAWVYCVLRPTALARPSLQLLFVQHIQICWGGFSCPPPTQEAKPGPGGVHSRSHICFFFFFFFGIMCSN